MTNALKFYTGAATAWSCGDAQWTESFTLDDYCGMENRERLGTSDFPLESRYSLDDEIFLFLTQFGWNEAIDSKLYLKTDLSSVNSEESEARPVMLLGFTRLLDEMGKLPTAKHLEDFRNGVIALKVVQIEVELTEYTSKPVSSAKLRKCIKTINNKGVNGR